METVLLKAEIFWTKINYSPTKKILHVLSTTFHYVIVTWFKFVISVILQQG